MWHSNVCLRVHKKVEPVAHVATVLIEIQCDLLVILHFVPGKSLRKSPIINDNKSLCVRSLVVCASYVL